MLASEVNLPVVIHSRDAAKDTLDIMKEMQGKLSGGVIHCFSYSTEIAMEYIKMGYYIGVGGVVTFNNGRKLKEVVEAVPLDRIVLKRIRHIWRRFLSAASEIPRCIFRIL